MRNGQELIDLFDLYMVGIRVVFFTKQHLSKQRCVIAEGKLVNLLWSNNVASGAEPARRVFDYSQNAGAVYVKKVCDNCLTTAWLQVTPDSEVSAEKFATIMAHSEVFVSVGKTCEISRIDQMVWRTLDHVIETLFYCDVDVRLTFALERVAKSITDMFNTSFLDTYPYRIMQIRSGQKVLCDFEN